ncbi:MAG: hypothetical protein AUJ75_02930 [Candidatus Omnitrophica bacterium CG1_02_49_10]|nr:MAG: hypothetical protein AUJ75_02930 [Candidatus Omnitrophica bacterium CG1_02_49_10]
MKSKDTSANLAVEDKDTNGALLTFTTTKDSTGPVISDIEAVSVTKDSAAITWATDELATSQVQYGTGGSYNNFTVLDEDLETSHSVVMKALNPSTGYSYLVISKDSSGNESVSSIYLLTTLDDTSAAGEGSIDGEGEEAVVEEDTTAPTIFSVAAASVGDTSATITWLTNESSTSQVEYGTGTSYGSSTTIDIDLELSHTSALSGLTADTAYHYKVRSKDSSGNEAVSGDYTFTTLKESESEGVEEKAVEEEKKAGAFLSFVGSLFRRDSGASSDVKKASSEASEKAAMVEAKRVADIPIIGTSGPVLADISSTEATIAWTTTIPANSIVAFRPESQGDEPMEASFISAGDFNKFVEEHAVNLKGLYPNTVYEFQVKSMDSQGKVNASGINNFETLSEPTIFDVKASDITSDSAVITWKTNIPASSKVEYGSGAGYGKKAEDSKGLSFTTLHVSGLKGLESEKVYHYRVASTDLAGRVLTSGDMTFKTPPRPKIGEYSIAQLTPEKAVLKWKTNVECDSTVEYTPYRKKKLIKAEAMAQMKPELSLEHEMIIGGLEIGITYQIKIKSKDLHGNDAAMKIPDYTAKVDTTPLEISQVRARNALLAGNEEKIQTIISWQTSRPASSQIIYQAGVKKDPRSETKTPLDTNLTTNHVVVLTSLRPAAIYRFNVASVDGFNNSVTSEDYTLLTPQKKKGIIQVIAEGFEEKFGWVKNIRGGK